MLSSFSHLRASLKSAFTKRKPTTRAHPTTTTTTTHNTLLLVTKMQANTTPEYQGSFLSQTFDTSAQYPDYFDEFENCEIGKVRIAEIPSQIKEKHLKIWNYLDQNVDFITTTLSNSIKIAQMLHILKPYVNLQQGGWQHKADLHHAFIRLM